MARSRLSGKVGAALDPCAAIQVPFELADGQEREIVFRLGVGRNAADAGSLVQRFRGPTAARGALDAVRAHWKRTLGAVQVETPDAVAQRAGQRLAAVPDAGVPPVGAQRLLPVGRGLRLPRPVAGRDGARPRRARAHARAPAALRGPSVRRRRRPALVASAVGPGRAHALLGRLSLAAAGDGALREGDRRHRRAGRIDPVPRRPPGEPGGRLLLRSARPVRGIGQPLPALRARHRAWPAIRRARPAADGLRRLERRHEPGRDQGRGRKRLAGLLPLCTC